jgi:hypothetical protein
VVSFMILEMFRKCGIVASFMILEMFQVYWQLSLDLTFVVIICFGSRHFVNIGQ